MGNVVSRPSVMLVTDGEGSAMAEWLQDWAQVLSAFGTILMMMAWVFYAQFAIYAYLNQRRSRVVIDQTEDYSLNTKFVIVNLSELPVYVTCVMIVVNTGSEEKTRRISTYSHFMRSDETPGPREIESELRHGTLDPAGLLMIGGSDRLLSWLLDSDDDDPDIPRGQRLRQVLSEIEHFDIRVMAMAGNQDKPIASRRRFCIEADEDNVTIYPAYSQTQHFNSWRTRKTADEWSDQCMSSPASSA